MMIVTTAAIVSVAVLIVVALVLCRILFGSGGDDNQDSVGKLSSK